MTAEGSGSSGSIHAATITVTDCSMQKGCSTCTCMCAHSGPLHRPADSAQQHPAGRLTVLELAGRGSAKTLKLQLQWKSQGVLGTRWTSPPDFYFFKKGAPPLVTKHLCLAKQPSSYLQPSLSPSSDPIPCPLTYDAHLP
jgi:hypothetical protein